VSATPIPEAAALPMIDPMMPNTMVSQMGMACRPGRMIRAMTPRIRPSTMAHSQFMSPPRAAVSACRASFLR
jgi:hypothetical protein